MSEWKARRFWTSASVETVEGGYTVHLDTRAVKTPLKAPLIVPTQTMAEAIAAEWMAQAEEINPLTMPVTRSANAAIDKVSAQKPEVVAMLSAYAETDLLCHRADHPQELAARQEAGWRPVLDWAASELNAPLIVTIGVLPVPQPQDSLDRVHQLLSQFDNFSLTELHDRIPSLAQPYWGLPWRKASSRRKRHGICRESMKIFRQSFGAKTKKPWMWPRRKRTLFFTQHIFTDLQAGTRPLGQVEALFFNEYVICPSSKHPVNGCYKVRLYVS